MGHQEVEGLRTRPDILAAAVHEPPQDPMMVVKVLLYVCRKGVVLKPTLFVAESPGLGSGGGALELSDGKRNRPGGVAGAIASGGSNLFVVELNFTAVVSELVEPAC